MSENVNAPYIEEILPDGHHEIIFNLNSVPSRQKIENNIMVNDPTLFFSGQNKKSYIQKITPGAIIYGIRFHPHTQPLFYDCPASLLTDNLVPLSDIFPADSLWHCFDESTEITFARLEDEFIKRATNLKSPDNAFLYVEAAVRRIMHEKGNIKAAQLEKITGVSARYLEKSFQKYVGLTPKQLSNIMMYSHFITYKKKYPEKTLSQCAHEANFYDQAHLIHLSNNLTGQSPKIYFGKLNHINDFFLEA